MKQKKVTLDGKIKKKEYPKILYVTRDRLLRVVQVAPKEYIIERQAKDEMGDFQWRKVFEL